MDILERKFYLPELHNINKILQFKNNKIDVKGTSSYKSQKYFSDYDLFSSIKGNNKPEDIFKEVQNIFSKIKSDPNLYFIELKIQNKNSKKKFFNMDFTEKQFVKSIKDLDYIKIDLIARFGNIFIEVSIIYSFNKEEANSQEYINSLKDDIKELMKEGNYYKVLKRYFALYKTMGDSKKLLELTKYFNSDKGALYQKTSNLKALKLLLENYDDDNTIKKIIINLKDIKEEPDYKIINKNIKKYEKIYNSDAKNIIQKFDLN